jgi:hypothetical protein
MLGDRRHVHMTRREMEDEGRSEPGDLWTGE